MKSTILLLLVILAAVYAKQQGFDKPDTMMSTVKTNVVSNVNNENDGKYTDQISFKNSRFSKTETVKSATDENMAKFGLRDVDEDMEVSHSEYKKESKQRKKLTEKTNKKISKSLETIKDELDGKIEKIDDETELLKSLLKLAILKKAVQIHIDEVEANIHVDMKVQDQVVKQIAELENLIYEKDNNDKVYVSYASTAIWGVYVKYVENAYGFVTIFDKIRPYPARRGRVLYGWLPYLTRYYRWSYSYYWPGVVFDFWGYGYYRLYSYLPTTYYYSSFVSYYDYAYVVTDELNELEELEEEAEQEINDAVEDIEDPEQSIEELEETFNDSIDEMKELNKEITEKAEQLIDDVTEGEADHSNALSELDLNDEEFRSKGDDILASFDEEIAEDSGSADDEPLPGQENDVVEEGSADEEEGSADEQSDIEELAEIDDFEQDLLGDDASQSDAQESESEEAESSEEEAESSEEEVAESSEEEVAESSEEEEASQSSEEEVAESSDEDQQEFEEEGEEEEEDECEQYRDDPEAYRKCQEGDDEDEEDQQDDMFGGDQDHHQTMDHQSGGGFDSGMGGGMEGVRKSKSHKVVSGFHKTISHLHKNVRHAKFLRFAQKLSHRRRR